MTNKVQNAGHDDEGRKIRWRHCLDCGHKFGSVEVALPPEFQFGKTDVYMTRQRRSARYSNDRIFVGSVRIIKGKKSDYCMRGLHPLRGRNVYVNPTTGHRICKPCNRLTTQKYRAATSFERLRKERERYHRNRERKLQLATTTNS